MTRSDPTRDPLARSKPLTAEQERTLRDDNCSGKPAPGRWAFLDTETGDWIEVKGGTVHIRQREQLPDHASGGVCWCQPLVETDPATGGRLFIHRRTLDSAHIERTPYDSR